VWPMVWQAMWPAVWQVCPAAGPDTAAGPRR